MGVVIGIGLNFAVAWVCLPWVVGAGPPAWWAFGVLWVAVMLGLDVGFGRWYLRYPWRRIARDFDPREGGWQGLGVVALLVTPWVVAVARGLRARGLRSRIAIGPASESGLSNHGCHRRHGKGERQQRLRCDFRHARVGSSGDKLRDGNLRPSVKSAISRKPPGLSP